MQLSPVFAAANHVGRSLLATFQYFYSRDLSSEALAKGEGGDLFSCHVYIVCCTNRYKKIMLQLIMESSMSDEKGDKGKTVQCPVPPANTPSRQQLDLVIKKLGEFMKCEVGNEMNDSSPCNTFASRGLEAIYGVKDFKTGKSSHQSANGMWNEVHKSDSQWKKLGAVLDEQNNLCAQSIANAGWPVIALRERKGHGHVALVIPGELKDSGSWGMKTANSASFFYRETPEEMYSKSQGYLDKALSSAFIKEDAKDAVFFYRNVGVENIFGSDSKPTPGRETPPKAPTNLRVR